MAGREQALVGWERLLCAILIVLAVALHWRFFVTAGPLWRDEADQVLKSTTPALSGILGSLSAGPFPVLSYLVFRAWSVAGDSDLWFRGLGLILGLSACIAFWVTGWRLHRRIPLLAAALFTLCPAMIIEGDSVRAYGIGILFPLLTYLYLWKTVSKPAKFHAAFAALFGILSVHSIYPNAVTFAAIGLAAGLVALRHRWWKRLARLAAVGLTVGLTVLPYAGIMGRFSQWRKDLVPLFGYRGMGFVLGRTFDLGLPNSYLLWIALIALSFGCLIALWSHSTPWTQEADRLDLPLYAVGTLILGLLFQILFVKRTALTPFERYFITPLALSALALESMLQADGKWRIARNGIVTALIAACAIPVWNRISVRRTNIDIIARGLEAQASRKDLIILTKCYLSYSFDRYYHGQAPWTTSPWTIGRPAERDHQETLMRTPGAVERTLSDISKVWASGGQVWVVGWVPSFILKSPPPVPPDWNLYRYNFIWDQRLFGFLEKRGTGLLIPVTTAEPVNPLENLALMVWTSKKP